MLKLHFASFRGIPPPRRSVAWASSLSLERAFALCEFARPQTETSRMLMPHFAASFRVIPPPGRSVAYWLLATFSHHQSFTKDLQRSDTSNRDPRQTRG
jgi:hypothetical protein